MSGIVELDSDAGKAIGFTSDKFDGYLWCSRGVITISFIMSRKRGNFASLVKTIQEKGFAVDVPTPLGRMEAICRKHGVCRQEPFAPEQGMNEACEIWRLKPINDNQ